MEIPDDLVGYEPITLQQLVDMNVSNYEDIVSYVWRYDKPRGFCMGIANVEVQPAAGTSYNLSWSDSLGDPMIFEIFKHTPINKFPEGEIWQYGLFKKI